MTWQQLVVAALCLWTAIMTVAYFREYIRRKRLLMELKALLAEFTYRSTEYLFAHRPTWKLAAQDLEEIINKEV